MAAYGDLLHAPGVEYEIAIGMRTGRSGAVVAGRGRTEREFSERARDLLDVVRPGLEGPLRATAARGRLARALAANPPPGAAVVLLDRYGEIERSSLDAERWLAEHFAAAERPGWLPGPVAEWLALPPRPPLVSELDGRRLTICGLPGDPHVLLIEANVASFRTDALDRLCLTARETEVPRAATVIEDEADIAWELFISLHAVRERRRLDAKFGVRTAADAVARALGENASTSGPPAGRCRGRPAAAAAERDWRTRPTGRSHSPWRPVGADPLSRRSGCVIVEAAWHSCTESARSLNRAHSGGCTP